MIKFAIDQAALDRILDDLKRMEAGFDLSRNHLGESLLTAAADGVMANMDAEIDPVGVPWEPLSESYAAQKAQVAPGAPMSVLHGILKQRDQIEGERSVTRTEASMTYGITDQAKQEAEWFQEGGGPYGQGAPPRPFYALTAEAVANADAICDAELARLVGP